jgi:uncharacterized membrane protein
MAFGNRNGANSIEMTASDGRTHRRAIAGSGSFAAVREEVGRESRGRFASSAWLGFARLPLERAGFEWNRHREERSDAAIQESRGALCSPGLLRFARNDDRSSTRVQFCLAFALLVIFSAPARADFRVCNKTHALINIAVGTDAGEAFRTEGWWVATPGSCATPVRGPLKSRFVYLYATDIDGVDLVTGTATMCIDRGKFVAYGAENCWRRGLQAVTFAEIDTLDSGDWTTFLTDPRK